MSEQSKITIRADDVAKRLKRGTLKSDNLAPANLNEQAFQNFLSASRISDPDEQLLYVRSMQALLPILEAQARSNRTGAP
ncbi:MAG: hypothetical protein AAFY25_04865 [Pseudomonadota bacterium]